MSSLDNVACVTYTTSKYADVWPMYFGQLNEHLNGIKSYVLSDFGSGKIYNFAEQGHTLIEHDDAEPYWAQYTRSLDLIPEDYVVYCQEDFFLYADVNRDLLQKALDFLENSDYDYVRLIRCGYQTPLKDHVKDNFFEVDMATQDAFSMQATLWKKSRMRQLYTHVASQKWLESEAWNVGARQIKIKGVFTWNGEPQVGKFHYDSIIWPYCCTGINKGQWNMDEYPEIMKNLVKKYNVDVSIRGVRKR
jgi:hypothetical protein